MSSKARCTSLAEIAGTPVRPCSRTALWRGTKRDPLFPVSKRTLVPTSSKDRTYISQNPTILDVSACLKLTSGEGVPRKALCCFSGRL